MPDRLAFYSYAHVPWIKGNGQRGFNDSDLPSAVEKRGQYESGKKYLAQSGFVEIGMDHFAYLQIHCIKQWNLKSYIVILWVTQQVKLN